MPVGSRDRRSKTEERPGPLYRDRPAWGAPAAEMKSIPCREPDAPSGSRNLGGNDFYPSWRQRLGLGLRTFGNIALERCPQQTEFGLRMSVSASPARYALGLTLGLLLALVGLSVAPTAVASVVTERTGGDVGLVKCGQWLPVENLAGVEDIRRQTAPLLLRRTAEPVADGFRAPARVRLPLEYRFRLVSGPPQRHRAVFDSGRRPLLL